MTIGAEAIPPINWIHNFCLFYFSSSVCTFCIRNIIHVSLKSFWTLCNERSSFCYCLISIRGFIMSFWVIYKHFKLHFNVLFSFHISFASFFFNAAMGGSFDPWFKNSKWWQKFIGCYSVTENKTIHPKCKNTHKAIYFLKLWLDKQPQNIFYNYCIVFASL